MDINPWVLKMVRLRKIHWCVLRCILMCSAIFVHKQSYHLVSNIFFHKKKHCCPPRGLPRFWHAHGIQLHLPKSHRSLASHQAQADKTSRCWHSSSTCFEGYVALPFSRAHLFSKLQKILLEIFFSKISSVMICYLWVRSKSWQIAVFQTPSQKKIAPETLLPADAVR